MPTQTPTSVVPTTVPTTVIPTTILPPLPTATISQTLTYAEALVLCTAEGVIDNPLTLNVNELDACAKAKLGG